MATQYASATELALYGSTPAALARASVDQQNAHLLAASQVADGFLGSRFKVPLTQVGADVRMYVAKIAAWTLMPVIGFKPGTQDADAYHLAYQDAMKWFERVQAGAVTPMGVEDSDSEDIGTSDTGQGAPFVVSPASADLSSVQDREADFFGHTRHAVGGVVGAPWRRGWNG